MLEPDDRSVLLELLRPPAGMHLDVGVATTFTLNLDAALVAPLAFASFSAAPGDPIAALEAVRSVAERLTVFCQAGGVAIPKGANDLYAFLEPIVHEVHRPRPGRLFHPKLWLLRFANDDGSVVMRMLVPTRNLTNDACWDTVLRVDGTVGKIDSYNEPLKALIDWCVNASTRPLAPTRRHAIESLTQSTRRAEWDFPRDVTGYQFHTLGLGGRSTVPDFSGRRSLVVSPFVDAGGLDIVAPTGSVVLVSRPSQMERLSTDTVQELDTRWIASVDLETQPGAPSPLGELHAKLVVVDRAKQAIMFVGSANATLAAFDGNIEILVELIGGPKAFGVETVLKSMATVVERCDITGGAERGEREELQRALDSALRDAATAGLTITVAPTGDHYALTLTSVEPLLPADFPGGGKAELLTKPGLARNLDLGAKISVVFDDIALADITPFAVLRFVLHGPTLELEGSAVVRAEIIGDPPDRLDAVLARQFDTPDKFLRFLFLLLGLQGGQIPPWLQLVEGGTGAGPATDPMRIVELGVFETLMRALATNLKGLDDLARLVDRLNATEEGRARLPEGFAELWTAVKDARDLLLTGKG